LETSGARQHFLNEISRNVSAKTVKVTTDYRKNLIRYTGFDPGKAAEAHHVFSQKYRANFFKAGIDIDDPKYLAWVEKNFHRTISRNYNEEWARVFRNNPSAKEILDKGRTLADKYNFCITY
ncbi:MAG: DUF2380 domain-containing protein, partial [Verrucomicrobiota bacterium]|nr:DUF2380 domain-containing protein [Verrucomicrobiota bacterium]